MITTFGYTTLASDYGIILVSSLMDSEHINRIKELAKKLLKDAELLFKKLGEDNAKKYKRIIYLIMQKTSIIFTLILTSDVHIRSPT